MIPGDDDESKNIRQQMQGMASMMSVSATVTPTEETKEIKGYKCTRNNIEFKMGMMGVTTVNWVTADIDIDSEAYNKVAYATMALMPGGEGVIKELSKLKGVLIRSTGSINMMGSQVNVSTELVDISEGDAPEGAYEIPKGYKKVAFALKMGR